MLSQVAERDENRDTHTQHDKQKECKQDANREEKTYVWAQLAADEANSDSS